MKGVLNIQAQFLNDPIFKKIDDLKFIRSLTDQHHVFESSLFDRENGLWTLTVYTNAPGIIQRITAEYYMHYEIPEDEPRTRMPPEVWLPPQPRDYHLTQPIHEFINGKPFVRMANGTLKPVSNITTDRIKLIFENNVGNLEHIGTDEIQEQLDASDADIKTIYEKMFPLIKNGVLKPYFFKGRTYYKLVKKDESDK